MARLLLWLDLFERAHNLDLRIRQRKMRRRRRRQLVNPFDLPDAEFIGAYRLTKSLVENLIQELDPLMPSTRKSTDISLETKVFIALNFYATGLYQRSIAQHGAHCISQQMASTAIGQVTAALNSPQMRNKYIKFPQTFQERDNVQKEFYEKFKMPGVIGCIDGTQIAVVRPKEHEERYYNRKGYHSINVQVICDASLNIMSVDASHPGATHDSYIWNSHPVKPHIQDLYENHNENIWLLGDSGYGQREWMMTPIADATPGSQEEYYTHLHTRARNVVETCIGVLKARFRCLLKPRVLHYDPGMAGLIANACVILHNIANEAGLPAPDVSADVTAEDDAWRNCRTRAEEEEAAVVEAERVAPELGAGRAARAVLVHRLWSERDRAT